MLAVITQLQKRGMKLQEIVELIGRRELLEAEEARAVGSAPVEEGKEVESVIAIGEQFARRFPDRVVVVAIYNTELRDGKQTMVPKRILHLPKEALE